MDPEEQQQPGALSQGNDVDALGNDGNVSSQEQPTFQRVTTEEAATLPYDELKRRMKEERRLFEEGLLPASSATSELDLEESDGQTNAGASSQNNRQEVQRSGGQDPVGNGQQASDLQRLLHEAQTKAATLERERAEEKAAAEKARLEAQHRAVEARIAQAPAYEQERMRGEYMNHLGQQALSEYYGFLQSREQQIHQAELAQARVQVPELLSELADSIAQEHGLRNADALKTYIKSAEFKEILAASTNESAIHLAATNAGQWMKWQALQQQNANAAATEARRQKAAANNRIVRDTPGGGVPVGGGEMDIVRRINTMTKEEFFAWKKNELKKAQSA